MIKKDIDEYPYIKLIDIKINEKNIYYSLRNYISNILCEILYQEEVELTELETDEFGSKIIGDFIKKCDAIRYLNLSNSVFHPEGIKYILDGMDSFDDYYTLNLEGITLSLDNLKHIAQIIKNPKKKILLTDTRNLKKKSKVTKGMHRDFKNFQIK